MTAAARDGRSVVRPGTEEWLRRGPNQRMSRHNGQHVVKSHCLIPNAQQPTKPGQVQATLARTDIVKVLAVGAEAVCIGRPYLDPRRIRFPIGRALEVLRVEAPPAPNIAE